MAACALNQQLAPRCVNGTTALVTGCFFVPRNGRCHEPPQPTIFKSTSPFGQIIWPRPEALAWRTYNALRRRRRTGGYRRRVSRCSGWGRDLGGLPCTGNSIWRLHCVWRCGRDVPAPGTVRAGRRTGDAFSSRHSLACAKTTISGTQTRNNCPLNYHAGCAGRTRSRSNRSCIARARGRRRSNPVRLGRSQPGPAPTQYQAEADLACVVPAGRTILRWLQQRRWLRSQFIAN